MRLNNKKEGDIGFKKTLKNKKVLKDLSSESFKKDEKTKKIATKTKTGSFGRSDINKTVGNLGENIAVVFLEKRGFHIIDRNYRNTIGEIDIIAQKDDFYYVIEVRTLEIPSKTKNEGSVDSKITIIRDGEGADWLKPEISLEKDKIRKVKQAALKYCMDFDIKEENLKFMDMFVSLYHSGSRVTKNNLLSCKVKILPLFT